MNIKLIYGSDTGKTEYVVETHLMNELESMGKLDIKNVNDLTEEDWGESDLFVLGIPTWYDGELQSDWEDYFETFKEIDFTDKTVAIFGLGDQIGYDEWFCDGVGILAKQVLVNNGRVIGYTYKDDTYDFDTKPKSIITANIFYGLCLDEDTQDELSKDRVSKWVEQLKEEYATEGTYLDPDVIDFLERADKPGPWSEEDDKIHTVGGLTNDKDNDFMKFQKKQNDFQWIDEEQSEYDSFSNGETNNESDGEDSNEY